MKKGDDEIPLEKSALFDQLISTYPNIDRKGATMPYTSFNGNMFSFLSKDGVLHLRLPGDAADVFMKKYKTTLGLQHGIILKEYVVVPDALFRKTRELKKYFGLSLEYVKTLKPKATKRKK